MREITLHVPQGVGDCFWPYQKFYPYFDQINFHIGVGSQHPLESRAMPFMLTWPKVGKVDLVRQGMEAYARYPMRPILSQYCSDQGVSAPIPYACNAPLEQGIRIEDIDPGFPPAFGIPLTMAEMELPPEFVTLYVSGSKGPGIWSDLDWVQCMIQLYARYSWTYSGLPIRMIGAGYDVGTVNHITGVLQAMGFRALSFIDLPAANVNYLLSRTKFFVGYQSGLNVLADNLGTPQLMMYFIHLDRMRYTWCQPGHVEKRIFNAFLFSQSPAAVVSALEWDDPGKVKPAPPAPSAQTTTPICVRT